MGCKGNRDVPFCPQVDPLSPALLELPELPRPEWGGGAEGRGIPSPEVFMLPS